MVAHGGRVVIGRGEAAAAGCGRGGAEAAVRADGDDLGGEGVRALRDFVCGEGGADKGGGGRGAELERGVAGVFESRDGALCTRPVW